MATYYSQSSGNWSDLATWNTAADGSGSQPASIAAMDNQSVVIQAGHVVTFDVEDALSCDGSISGWTNGIAGITITGADEGATPGELTLTRASNTGADRIYGLRLKSGTQIIGTNALVFGKFTGGSATSPIPPTATHVIWALGLHATATISLAYLSFAMYGAAPVEPIYELTAACPAGTSALPCKGFRKGTNPEYDTQWRPWWEVCVAEAYGGQEYEAYRLAAVPRGDGVLYLETPLTVAKSVGALVSLSRRNISFLSSGNIDTYYIRYGAGAQFYNVAILHVGTILIAQHMIANGTDHVCGGATTIGPVRVALKTCTSCVLEENVVIAGCGYALDACTNCRIRGNTVLSGNNYSLQNGNANIVEGNAVICGSRYAMIYGTAEIMQGNASIRGCTYGVYQCKRLLLHEEASMTGCSINWRIDAANSSVFCYTLPTGYGADMCIPYQLNQDGCLATPRCEIWHPQYEPAGIAADTRRYPTPWVI